MVSYCVFLKYVHASLYNSLIHTIIMKTIKTIESILKNTEKGSKGFNFRIIADDLDIVTNHLEIVKAISSFLIDEECIVFTVTGKEYGSKMLNFLVNSFDEDAEEYMVVKCFLEGNPDASLDKPKI